MKVPAKSRSFRTLLLTLVLVLALPMLLMLASLSTSIRALVQADYIAMNTQLVSRLQATLDSYVAARMDFASALSTNRAMRILAAGVDDTPRDTIDAYRELHQFCRSVQSYDRVFSVSAIYFPERGMVISSRNVYMTEQAFYAQNVGFQDMDSEAFFTLVTDAGAPSFYPVTFSHTTLGTTARLVLFSQPVNMGYVQPRAYFLSFLDAEAFQNVVGAGFDLPIHYRLLDGNNTELLFSDDLPEVFHTPLPNAEARWEIPYAQGRYHAFYGQSGTSSLRYVFYLPEALVLRRLSDLQRVWLLAAAGCLLLGGSLALYMAKRLYAPFQNVLAQAFPEGLAVGTSSIQQEYHIVAEKIRETRLLHARFQQEISAYEAATRETTLMKLITQSLRLPDSELSEAADLCGLPTECHLYQVLLLQSQTPLNISARLEEFQARCEAVTLLLATLEACRYVIVLAAPESALLEEAAACLVSAMHRVKAGLSTAYGNIRGLQRAVSEASIACTRHEPGEAQYVAYNALETEAGAVHYPIDVEMEILAAARGGKYEEARTLLRQLRTYNLEERKLMPEMIRSLYHSMVATAMKASEHLPREEGIQEAFGTALGVVSQEGPEGRMFSEVLGLYEKICEATARQMARKNKDIVENVIGFLDGHYTDPGLCLDMVAAHFQVSYYFLSRIFQEEAGRSFSDLVGDVRVREAEKLVLGTDMAIQDVATAVGYSNMTTFLRAFKKRMGMTPLQYRTARSGK